MWAKPPAPPPTVAAAPAVTTAASAPAVTPTEHPTGDPRLKNAAVALGKPPPEIHVTEWVGTEQPMLLRNLDGRPVLVSFCRLHDSACDDARAVLRDLHERHARFGLLVLEIFVDQPSARTPDWEHWANVKSAINALSLPWPAGFGERVAYTQLTYAFASVPAAYLVGADGKLVWSGGPKSHERSLRGALDAIVGRVP